MDTIEITVRVNKVNAERVKEVGTATTALSMTTRRRTRSQPRVNRQKGKAAEAAFHGNASKPQALRFTAASLPRSVWTS